MSTSEYRRLTAKFLVTDTIEIEDTARDMLDAIAAGRSYEIHEMGIAALFTHSVNGPVPVGYEIEATASIVEPI